MRYRNAKNNKKFVDSSETNNHLMLSFRYAFSEMFSIFGVKCVYHALKGFNNNYGGWEQNKLIRPHDY